MGQNAQPKKNKFPDTKSHDYIPNNQDRDLSANISLIEILSLAENSIGNLRQILDTFDGTIYNEFRQIAEQISLTKEEIGKLKAEEIDTGNIPAAGRELSAVVSATEDATHRIMEAAETIMTADPSDVGNYYNIVNDNIMAIFEACSFQDITGQRISRVVETLEFIDRRVSHFAERIGARPQDPTKAEQKDHYFDASEEKRDQRKKELLLYGPQNAEDAITQSDIDQLLGKE